MHRIEKNPDIWVRNVLCLLSARGKNYFNWSFLSSLQGLIQSPFQGIGITLSSNGFKLWSMSLYKNAGLNIQKFENLWVCKAGFSHYRNSAAACCEIQTLIKIFAKFKGILIFIFFSVSHMLRTYFEKVPLFCLIRFEIKIQAMYFLHIFLFLLSVSPTHDAKHLQKNNSKENIPSL